MNIPDNYDLWKKHDAEQQAELEERPLCDICEEHIQEDFYYNIGGQCVCEECLNDYFREEID